MFDLTVMDHCQDYSLVTEGVIHEGYWSLALGLRSWPAAGEEMIVARNILLAELTGARVHCQHLSAAGSVDLIRAAKRRGVPVSGEACPHHFTLTDSAIAGSEKFWAADGKQVFSVPGALGELPVWPAYDTNFKMNPPLRSAQDREAILAGLVDGTIEILCSDHAPHCDFEKEVEFDYAPFGIGPIPWTEIAAAELDLARHRRLLRLTPRDAEALFQRGLPRQGTRGGLFGRRSIPPFVIDLTRIGDADETLLAAINLRLRVSEAK